jgi:hypothetical protein
MYSHAEVAATHGGLAYLQLQQELKRCKLKATGGTLDLRRRLLAHINSSPTQTHPPDQEETPRSSDPTGPNREHLVPDPSPPPLPVTSQLPANGPVTLARPMPIAASSLVYGVTDPNTGFGFGGGSFTGSGGFDGGSPDGSDEDDDEQEQDGSLDGSDDEDDGATGSGAAAAAPTTQTQKKPKKKTASAAHFTPNCYIRMVHCLIEPESRTALGSIAVGRSRTQLDASYDGWEDIATMHNSKRAFDHPQLDRQGEYCGSPRINISQLDPNGQHSENRNALQLKKKWAELKKWVTPYFEKWSSSGQMTANTEEKSITDFLRPTGSDKSDRHPKEKVIKYVHLLMKGDQDLLTFASKAIGKGGRESGGQDGERPLKRSKAGGPRLDRSDLVAAMSVQTPAQLQMAAAWQTEAEAKLLSSVASILAQLDTLPAGPLRTLLEARITKLLADAPAAGSAEPQE